MNGTKTNHTEAEGVETILRDSSSIKFYISMLSISLIVGLLYCGFIVYKSRSQQTKLLSYIRNIVIVLLFRTFFSLLVAALIYLEGITNSDGIKTLFSFECIFLNLVPAFWCILGIYVHGKVRSREINMTLWFYGLPTVAVFFALVWIFVMTSQFDQFLLNEQWIVQSIRLLFLLVQLGLVIDMGRLLIIKKNSLDNDCKSLLLKSLAVVIGLLLVFWLQFGFSTGAYHGSDSYFNFWCFIDGFQLALLCPLFYLFEKWGGLYIYGDNFILTTKKRSNTNSSSKTYNQFFHEDLNTGKTSSQISTIQSIYRNLENEKSETNDVVYSSIVIPEKLQKTINLYNRFNVLVEDRMTVFQNENFYDCIDDDISVQIDDDKVESQKNSQQNISAIDVNSGTEVEYSNNSQTSHPKAKSNVQNDQFETFKKKTAFYKSKYLIMDDEQNEFQDSSIMKAPKGPYMLKSYVNLEKKGMNENQKRKLMKAREEKLMKAREEILPEKSLSLESLNDIKTDESFHENEMIRKKQDTAGAKESVNEKIDFSDDDGTNKETKENFPAFQYENNYQDNNYVNNANTNKAKIDDILQTADSGLPTFFEEQALVKDETKCETKMSKQEKNSEKSTQVTPEIHLWKSPKIENLNTDFNLQKTKTYNYNNTNAEDSLQSHLPPDIKDNKKNSLEEKSELNFLSEYKDNDELYDKNDVHLEGKKKIESEMPQKSQDFPNLSESDKDSTSFEIYDNINFENSEKKQQNRNSITSNFYKDKKQINDDFSLRPDYDVSDVNSFSQKYAGHERQHSLRITPPSSESEFEIETASEWRKMGKNNMSPLNKNEDDIKNISSTENSEKTEKNSSFSSSSEFEIEFFKTFTQQITESANRNDND